MDIMIVNRDISVLPNGYPETVEGFDEIFQRVIIGLSFLKGEFAYDRNLGILRENMDFESENAMSTIESCINEALVNTDVYVSVNSITVDEGQVTLALTASDGHREKTTEVSVWTAT